MEDVKRDKEKIIEECRVLIEACKTGKLGCTRMPEDSNPGFSEEERELRLAYFSLPMGLNYQFKINPSNLAGGRFYVRV